MMTCPCVQAQTVVCSTAFYFPACFGILATLLPLVASWMFHPNSCHNALFTILTVFTLKFVVCYEHILWSFHKFLFILTVNKLNLYTTGQTFLHSNVPPKYCKWPRGAQTCIISCYFEVLVIIYVDRPEKAYFSTLKYWSIIAKRSWLCEKLNLQRYW